MDEYFDLDDLQRIQTTDPDRMLAHIDALPDQFENAWNLSQTLPLPETHRQPKQIVLTGMGGSAIGGDLIAALISRTSPVPLIVVRGYELPAWISGSDTLVIASSFSGGTEETLTATDQAVSRGVRMLGISTGGALADHAQRHGYPLWPFEYRSQPRAALGWSFGLLIGLAHRLNLAPDLEASLREAVALMREQRVIYGANNPAPRNPAKRDAGQWIDRIPVVYGGGMFEPVARRWKGQLNENAKAWAQYEPMPEANHNAIVGIEFPKARIPNMLGLFITSPQYDHPRVKLRHDLTYNLFLQHGIMADKFVPKGQSALAQMCHAIQHGDYASFYVAMAYGADPTPVTPIIELKTQMAQVKS
ncbi:MAG: bifunctional phosphoglucose/phosphomannose isomerase [Chloroflexi bacterium]|nr:bifunctional phosphoglucose/phosphomannose isomerase [Chloroflexota bacterium]